MAAPISEHARRIRIGIMRRNQRLAFADPSTSPLRRERLRRELTISELAERAGVARNTLHNAELARHGTLTDTYGKLAKALGVPVDVIQP